MRRALALFLAGLWMTPIAAQAQAEGRSLLARSVGGAVEPPTLDGRLDDPAWEGAEVARGLIQMSPRPGEPSVQQTEARVVFTNGAIYVGMRMFDTAIDSIAAPLARRDASGVYSDWAHVTIDSYHDRRTAFRFAVNPRGVQKDIFHYNDSEEDLSWDAVWDVATRVDSLGWVAEFRIPLSQLRFDNQRGGALTWGINFGREIARYDERSYWAPVERNSGRFVSNSGELHGLSGLPTPRQLELQPYAVSHVTRAPGELANPFYRQNALGGAVGMDLKYGLTSDLTLTATLNPDFGQVEADPSEVNLTAFETLYSERRPFFQEGTDIFSGMNLGQVDPQGGERLFYSRRIGRTPQRRLGGEGFVDRPDAATILGAAKVSGKTRDGWSVGVLSTVTAAEHARVSQDGITSHEPVEPMSHFGMARVSRDLNGGQSAMGGVLLTTHRQIEPGGPLDFLRRAAYVGGFDGRHRFGGGLFEVDGALFGSRVEGSPRAMEATQRASARYFQRPDATHLELDPTRTSLGGVAATANLQKIGGGNWRGGVRASLRTPGFEANDLGFLRTADARTVLGGISYVDNQPGRWVRNYRWELAGGSTWTFGNERTFTAGVFEGNVQLANFWGAGGALIRIFPSLSPVALRGGPALAIPARSMAVGGMQTDPRKPVRWGAEGDLHREDETGGWGWGLQPSVTVRPSQRTLVSLAPRVARSETAWQYLTRQSMDGEPRYLGARLDQTTVSLTARVNYALTPDLSIQFYAQPFVSAGAYSDLREVSDPRARAFDARFLPIPASRLSSEPDFNVQQLNSNAVLRWQYAPGSALFVVWSQGRQGAVSDGSFNLTRDFGRLMGTDSDHPTPGTHVLLLKVSHWFGR
jgi:hypothetical protein